MADDPLLAPEPDADFAKRYAAPAAPTGVPGEEAPSAVPKWDVSALEVVQESISKIVTAHRALNAGANKVLAQTLDAPTRLVNMAYKAAGGDPNSNLLSEGQVEKILNMMGISTSWDNTDELQRIAAKFGEGAALSASVLLPVAGTASVIANVPRAAQIGLRSASVYGTKAEQAQALARSVVIDPYIAAPGAFAAGELAAGAVSSGVDQIAQEMGIQNDLARFGISTVAGVAAGAPFAIGAARAVRQGADGQPIPSAKVAAESVAAQDVFSPKMAAELTQADLADDILRRIGDRGIKVGPRRTEGFIKEYEDSMVDLDPDGRIWPLDIRKQMVDAFTVRLQAKEYPSPRAPKSTGDEARAYLSGSREARDKTESITAQKVITSLQRGLVDKIAGTRSALLKAGGDEGAAAQMHYDLSLGAPSWAEDMMKGARRDIYAGLAREERHSLDDLILSERFSQIRAYRPSNKGPVSSPDEWLAMRANLKAELGESKFNDLQRRSQAYFDRIRVPLADMKKSGLISGEEYDKLSRFQYSPIEYLDKIDPTTPMMVGRRKISVSSSGLTPLSNKQKGLIETDTEALMANVFARVYSRISRNKANQDLLDLARRDKENPVVSLKKQDKDWTRISVMENGKPKRFYMKNEFAEEWVNTPAGMEGVVAKLFSAPADAVRLMATGINPEFPLYNLPRDWLYAWLAPNQLFGKTYSSFMPLGFGQLAKDLTTVLPDVLTNGKRVQDYIREGGGMSFLTHGARGETVVTDKNNAWKIAKDVLGIVNSRSELWTRLAIRERALQSGMDPEQATWTARTQIDFSQGGSAVKVLDRFIPYLNASIQGLRGMARAAKQDPVGFSAKITQAMGATAGLWTYNNLNHKEGYAQVDDEIKANNFVIMLPGHYVDAEGNKRYNYLKIPVEHGFSPWKAASDAMMEKYWYGKTPKRELVQGVQNSLSILGDPSQALPPAVKALFALGNWDTWRMENVWKGQDNIPASQEYKEFPDTPTPRIAVDLAQAMAKNTGIELSPERMTAATRSMLPANVYTLALTSLYNKATTGYVNPEGEDTRILPQEMLTGRVPFLRKFLGTTHPLANIMSETNEQVESTRGENVALNREADKRVARIFMSRGEDQLREREAFDGWVKSDLVPVEDKKRLVDRFVSHTQIRKVFEARDTKGLPEIGWWINVAALPADQRASIFAWQMREADAEKRERLRNVAASIPSFWTDNFVRALKSQEKKEGIK